MKVVCDRERLAESLARVCRATSGRAAVRILAGVRLTAADGVLTLAATDFELAMTTSLEARVAEDGAAVLPARALLAVVQAIAGDVVELSTAEGAVAVSCGDSRFRLNALPLEDFPELPVLRDPTRVELDALLLGEIGRMVRVASTDLSRPVYTGVRLTVADETLTLTATDGYRLATASTKLPAAGAFDVLVPARALTEVVRLAGGSPQVAVELTPNLIRFTVASCEVTSRTLDGRPQDHERILAAPFAHRAEVPRASLLRAVDRAALVAERGGAVELSFSDREVHVRARSAELGEADERVALPAAGPTLRIGFNPRYLRDGLELVHGDDVCIEMNSSLQPIVMHGAADDFAYLVAPQRLPD